eukprot:gene18534-5991_t
MILLQFEMQMVNAEVPCVRSKNEKVATVTANLKHMLQRDSHNKSDAEATADSHCVEPQPDPDKYFERAKYLVQEATQAMTAAMAIEQMSWRSNRHLGKEVPEKDMDVARMAGILSQRLEEMRKRR